MNLALIGVGLIGGSLAKALRKIEAVETVVGFDADTSALQTALQTRVIDDAAASPGQAADDADVVVVATPVGSMEAVFQSVAPHLKATTILTDVGSTKQSVMSAARRTLGPMLRNFVPGHPIAGRHVSGVLHSDSDLFKGKVFVSTPVADTDQAALTTVENLWKSVGCRVERMTSEQHDEVFAAVSHLPHVLAFSLVSLIASVPDAERRFALAGSSFADFSRLAASNTSLWADICVANRLALTSELRNFQHALQAFERVLASGSVELVRQQLERRRTFG